MLNDDRYTIEFPDEYFGGWDEIIRAKGWLDVCVRFADGRRFELHFFTCDRARNELAGRPYFAEPGLVLVDEVEADAVKTAVAGLIKDDFFAGLRECDK